VSYEAPQYVGLVERAAKLALKYGVTYDAKWHEFKGDPEGVKKATDALAQWAHKDRSEQFRAGRRW
jgi:hypothetical protein